MTLRQVLKYLHLRSNDGVFISYKDNIYCAPYMTISEIKRRCNLSMKVLKILPCKSICSSYLIILDKGDKL